MRMRITHTDVLRQHLEAGTDDITWNQLFQKPAPTYTYVSQKFLPLNVIFFQMHFLPLPMERVLMNTLII